MSSATDRDMTARRRGGLLGLLVGDALGVPYEFHAASTLPARDHLEMTPPGGFHRAHASVPPGTWSDDGAQALVLLESLTRLGRLDADDLAAGFLRWRDDGFLAVDGIVFDIGIQTADALRRISSGTPAASAGSADERANGNGSLMRVLPLALLATGTDADLVADACAQSAVTHRHPRSMLCCALYCLWARRLLADATVDEGWDDAVRTLRSLRPAGLDDLEEHVIGRVDDPPRGTGYVVHSLLAARHLLRHEPGYEDVVRGAIALGDDTDTTAAIAGGLAGIVYGENGIPGRWLASLRGRDLLDPLLARLP